MEKETFFTLSKQDTAVMKGMAIIAMLCHHVYACAPEWALPCSGFLHVIGHVGKACVAMFIFCSGYGLSVQYTQKSVGTLRFMLRRFAKFYANYWVIFIIFVPITVIFFGRTLSSVYGGRISVNLAKDMVGINGFSSYNITWWFNKLIIILYLLFPLLFFMCRKNVWVTLTVSFIACVFYYKVDFDYSSEVLLYILPFVMGIAWVQLQDSVEHIGDWCRRHRVLFVCISLSLLFASVLCRMHHILPKLDGIRMDGFISLCTAMLVIGMRPFLKTILSILAFFGKHSVNIYLLHTFIMSYWMSKYLIYSYLSGGARFTVLFVICLLTSIIIEWLKDKTGYISLTKKLISRI